MQFRFTSSGGILHQDTVEIVVIGIPHGTRHAHISCDPAKDQILNTLDIKHQLELSVLKSTATRFVDDILIGKWTEFGDDVVSCLAAD
jgi:hypothetical protein